MTLLEPQESPPWNRSVKITVAIGSILFAIVILWRFQTLITPLIIAVILAYLLNPIIVFIDERTPHLGRATVTTIVYLTVALLFIVAMILIGVGIYSQFVNLLEIAPAILQDIPVQIEQLRTILSEPIKIGSFEYTLPIAAEGYDWQPVVARLQDYINPAIGTITTQLGNFALAAITTLGWLVFILFVSIYISNDIPRIGETIGGIAAAPGYRADAERLWREFGRVWNAYLRGQVILGLVIFVVVSITLIALGVENALALGLLSGLLEFIPMIGPIIGTAAAVIVAIFQPDNYLGLSTIPYGLIILAAMTLIQQIENSVLVPRIVGDALDLHPVLVLVGAIMGGSLGGILGAILAAPVIATLKLLGSYAWRKMFDLPPFDTPEIDISEEPSWIEAMWERWQMRRAKSLMEKEK